MSVAMQALKVHDHFDPTGTFREIHYPGDRYELHDSIGMTAEQLANVFEAQGSAVRLVPRSKPAKKA